MKTRIAMFDHDLEYGRDIRLAGVAALVLVTAAFLFLPQPVIRPFQLRGPVGSDYVVVQLAPDVYVPPKPVEPVHTTIPLASSTPEAVTIGRTTDIHELKPDTVRAQLEGVPFISLAHKPELVRVAKPEYPEMARAAGIEGKVVISMVVDTIGNVVKAEVYSTSGNTMLDQAAVNAAYKCGFVPGYQRDRPVIVRNVILPFNFRLQ
jgi:TonB family protein